MSRFPSDPAFVAQFRRRWDGASASIKFLCELSESDIDRLCLERGERILRRLPQDLTIGLTGGERRDLALAFGRPAVRRLRERRPP
jgi:hypothetical protein